jgi:hypothetical protein
MHLSRRPEMGRFARRASTNVNAMAVPRQPCRVSRAASAVPRQPCRVSRAANCARHRLRSLVTASAGVEVEAVMP